MATTTHQPAAPERPAPIKLPPPSGRPDGKGLESITRGEGEPAVKRVLVADLIKGKR